MRLLTVVTAAAILMASALQAATLSTARVQTWLSFSVDGDLSDLEVLILPFDLTDLRDIDGAGAVTASLAAADDIAAQTTVQLGATAGPGGGLVDLTGFADLSITLTNLGAAPLSVFFTLKYSLEAAASVANPSGSSAYAFSSVDVSSTLGSIAFFASVVTLLEPSPQVLAGIYGPVGFVLAPRGGTVIDVLTEAQVLIDATPIPLPPAGLLLVASLGALTGVRSLRRRTAALQAPPTDQTEPGARLKGVGRPCVRGVSGQERFSATS